AFETVFGDGSRDTLHRRSADVGEAQVLAQALRQEREADESRTCAPLARSYHDDSPRSPTSAGLTARADATYAARQVSMRTLLVPRRPILHPNLVSSEEEGATMLQLAGWGKTTLRGQLARAFLDLRPFLDGEHD